jgi:hypothetical protein
MDLEQIKQRRAGRITGEKVTVYRTVEETNRVTGERRLSSKGFPVSLYDAEKQLGKGRTLEPVHPLVGSWPALPAPAVPPLVDAPQAAPDEPTDAPLYTRSPGRRFAGELDS